MDEVTRKITEAMDEGLNLTQVATVNGKAVTRGELLKAFRRVENVTNWKYAIDAEVRTTPSETESAHELAVIREAVVFFTGSVPTFRHLGSWRFSVKAAGYYAAVGA